MSAYTHDTHCGYGEDDGEGGGDTAARLMWAARAAATHTERQNHAAMAPQTHGTHRTWSTQNMEQHAEHGTTQTGTTQT